MAQQGFDPSFGLRGTCASDVSGFGGRPLAVFEGIDGRPTLVCSATSQKKVDHDDVLHGNRFLKPQFSTLRVVSFPADGRPAPIGRDSRRTAIFGPDPTADLFAIRAIAGMDKDRIAVLGYVIRANREVPTLSIFTAGAIRNGVAPWTLSRSVELTDLSGINVRQYGLCWSGRDVIVVAAQLAPAGVEILIYADKTRRTVKVDFPLPKKQDLPANFNVNLRGGGVSFAKPDHLFIGVTWRGLDPGIPGLRPQSAIDRGRASVIALRQTRNSFSIEPSFGAGGIWLATLSDGEITTSDHIAVDSTGGLTIAGSAKQGTARSLFAASLDRVSGAVLWTSYPGEGMAARPAGMTAGAEDSILLCGTTRDWDINASSDPGDAVAIRLLRDGQPDAGFAVNGTVQFRLHGGTHPTACAETSAGEPLIASFVPWGWEAASSTWLVQPCLSRLTAAGDLDPTFGSAGLCRHDGLGSAEVIAAGPTGSVWSAGIVQLFPGDPQSPKLLTVSQCNVDGELESTFGNNGIATLQLPQWDDLEVSAIIPLADGRVVLNGTARLHGVVPTTGGSWLLRLQSNGRIDTTFGGWGGRWRWSDGTRFYPGRNIVLLSELNNGSLQGFESGAAVSVVTVGSNGTSATFTVVSKSLVNAPSVLEPSGDYYGLAFGKIVDLFEVGLVRFRNGAIDTMFGAGGASSSSTVGNPDPRFVNLASLGVPISIARMVGGDQTIVLSDGTFLTLWTLPVEVTVILLGGQNGTAPANSLLLLAWGPDGNPRVVPAWGRPGKVIKNPAGAIKSWLGWTYQCAVLQPDGSIVVCLAGDDLDAAPAFGQAPPLFMSQSPYFCRLVPPNFDRDPAFGGDGFLVRRAPGCDFVVPQGNPDLIPGMAENQVPISVKRIANGAVVAAIRCRHPNPAFGGVELGVPNLPLDGSLGIARLT